MKNYIFIFLIAIVFNIPAFSQESLKKSKLGTVEDGQKALATLNAVLSAYADGDSISLRQNLDFKMIGFQKFLDNATKESSRCKQITFKLVDTQVQSAPELVVIQTGWEKRCLLLPNMTPQYFKGHSTFLLQNAEGGSWNMTGVSGDSPLVPVYQN